MIVKVGKRGLFVVHIYIAGELKRPFGDATLSLQTGQSGVLQRHAHRQYEIAPV